MYHIAPVERVDKHYNMGEGGVKIKLLAKAGNCEGRLLCDIISEVNRSYRRGRGTTWNLKN
jgi:hypothetical protein